MIRAFLVNFTATMLGTALSTAATFLVVRALATDDWGVSASTLGLGQLIGAALSFGTQIERVRRYSALPLDQRSIEAKTDSSSRTVIAIALIAIGLLLSPLLPIAGSIVIAASGTYASLATTNFFIASKRFVVAGTLVAVEKLLLLVLVSVTIAAATTNVTTLPMAQGIAGVCIAVVAARVIPGRRLRLGVSAQARRLHGQYRSGFFLGVASLAPSFLLLDASIVVAIAGPSEAGAFALAARLIAPLTVATSALVAVLMPYLIAPTANDQRFDVRALALLVSGYFAALTMLAVSAPLWVPALFGSEYREAVLPVQLYIANAFVVFFTRILVTISQARGDDKMTSAFIATQVLLALVGISIGAHLAGSAGAAMSVVSTNVLLAVALGLRVRSSRSKTKGEPDESHD